MPDLQGVTLAIVGAGAIGLTLGARACQAGARTTVYGLGPAVASASSVAAGMLAPAFEAALDPLSSAHFDLLRAARDAWPKTIVDLDLPLAALDRSGALYPGAAADEPALEALARRLGRIGASCERLEAVALRRLRPELSPMLTGGVFTPEDWRIDPKTILDRLAAVFIRSGGRRIATQVVLDSDGRLVAGDAVIAADVVVVAAGPGALCWATSMPELAGLHPIKGQILNFDGEPRGGPQVRGPFGYVAPQPGGAMAGATMEIGRTDLGADAATVGALHAGAVGLFPTLAGAPYRIRVGVRTATLDGLPLVGRSRCAGVHLAVGARRNGWLLAPLIAQTILEDLQGRTAPYAEPMRAMRRILSPS